VDPTPGQLAIARRCQERFGPRFPLVLAVGEQVPLQSASVDFVISEYGAAIWADPYRWVPEAARVLRPGGELVFLGTSTLLVLCVPEGEHDAAGARLLRPQRGMHAFTWPDDGSVDFHLGHGDWIRLLVGSGFDVIDLVEVYAPEGAASSAPFVTSQWAHQWPCEEVWRARRRA
jgi:SAM-dependent methyltransferase